MFSVNKKLIAALIPFILSSCVLHDYNRCGIYLEFIFDHNMEYADSFDPQVETVDVYVFDEYGTFLFSRHADCKTELIDRKRMHLGDLERGTYRIVTVGGMNENFTVSDFEGNPCRSGSTSIDQIRLALDRRTGRVDHRFGNVWFGEAMAIDYRDNGSVWPVKLLRNTNNFNIVLQDVTRSRSDAEDESPYTFGIETPEGGAYGYDNIPVSGEPVTYLPYHLVPGEGADELSAARINTMRLIAEGVGSYRLQVGSGTSTENIWSYDFMTLLEKTKPTARPDGTPLPLQEYLDRQGEWNIVILYRGGDTSEGGDFAAVAVKVNGWILWLNDIDI